MTFLCPSCQKTHLKKTSKTGSHPISDSSLFSIYVSQGRTAFIQRDARLRVAQGTVEVYRKTENEVYSGAMATITDLTKAVELVHATANEILTDVERSISEASKHELPPQLLCDTVVHEPHLLKADVFRSLFDLRKAAERTIALNKLAASLFGYIGQAIASEKKLRRTVRGRGKAVQRGAQPPMACNEVLTDTQQRTAFEMVSGTDGSVSPQQRSVEGWKEARGRKSRRGTKVVGRKKSGSNSQSGKERR